jgi:hypothetical protein
VNNSKAAAAMKVNSRALSAFKDRGLKKNQRLHQASGPLQAARLSRRRSDGGGCIIGIWPGGPLRGVGAIPKGALSCA